MQTVPLFLTLVFQFSENSHLHLVACSQNCLYIISLVFCKNVLCEGIEPCKTHLCVEAIFYGECWRVTAHHPSIKCLHYILPDRGKDILQFFTSSCTVSIIT